MSPAVRPRRALAPLDPVARAFAIAHLVHLTLPDFAEVAWQIAGAPALLGAAVLLARGAHPLGFLLCGLSTTWTLLALRDVMTQSTLLTWVAAVGLFATRAIDDPSCAHARAQSARRVIAHLAGLTYLLATLHKLNDGFFNPAVSCAPHAWAQAAARWNLPAPAALVGALPALAVGLELAVGVALLRRSPWLWPLGVLFHLPLTATLAPAFQFTMMVGWVAALTPRQRVAWRRRLRRPTPLVVAALAALLADRVLAGPPTDPTDLLASLKVGLNAGLALAGLSIGARARPRDRRASPAPAPRRRAALLAAWTFHGLTPYLGLQYQHTAAMLSNLRIDDACHNSWLLPPGLRLGGDPYLRIDSARIGAGSRPAREAHLRATLWNFTALHTMRRNWCVPHLRPIALAGTWRGRPFDLPDLCADNWLDHLPRPAAWLPGFQAFQKNLARACDAPCVH